MNIFHPEIVRIGNRRYRKNPYTFAFQETNSPLAPYVEETPEHYEQAEADDNDEPCDLVNCGVESKPRRDNEDYRGIEKLNDNSFKLTMLVHESYFGFLIGRNGEKKLKLENETKTKIKIPKRGGGDWLIIEAANKSSIAKCRDRIELLIYNARHQKSFTHLLTFPLIFPALKDKFNQFQIEVLKKCMDDRGIDESIFQFPDKLHLTICTAVLLNKDEIDQACDLLDEWRSGCDKNLTNPKALRVNIRGLEYMNDDPSSVDVLYAKVVSESRPSPIQTIADDLMNKLCDSGLSKKQYNSEQVKLHATVINSLKRQDNSCSAEPTTKKERESFDARNILKHFGDYDFGHYVLNEIHLSLRFSVAPNGYYECVHKIKL